MTFQVGHKLGIGNQYRKGFKYSDEAKKKISERLKGNTNGFKIGFPSPRKGKKSRFPAWNKGRKLPEFSGENHPNWIKDRTKIVGRNTRTNDPCFKQWRLGVYKRDNYKCHISDTQCLGRIEAHHILRWKDYPELRYEIDNGITLCHFHHPRKKYDENRLVNFFRKLLTLPYHIQL